MHKYLRECGLRWVVWRLFEGLLHTFFGRWAEELAIGFVGSEDGE